MDNSPLNKAHQLQRRAEALLRQRKFNECIDTHETAADFLKQALLTTDNSLSIESLTLQKDYHLKQVGSLKIKKLQYEQHQNDRQLMNSRTDFADLNPHNEEQLETMIFRTMDCHDSLVELLIKRGKGDSDDGETKPNEDTCDGGVRNLSIRKHKVDDSTIIEEFKVLSEKLRESVQCLLDLLEEKNKEIERLKGHIGQLETAKATAESKGNSNNLKVITDSSGGTSPYIFSPCSELSPDINELRSLPPLPPLGMPDFDFSSIAKNSQQ